MFSNESDSTTSLADKPHLLDHSRCRHIEECGGCSTQKISYHVQLLEKQKNIEETFPSHLVEEIRPSKEPWHYRNKMEFSFSEDKKGKRFLGLYKSRARVIDLHECLITKSPAGELLAKVREWWVESGLHAYHPPKDFGSLQTLTLRSGINEMVILTVSGNAEFSLTRKQINAFVKAVQLKGSTSVYIIVKHIAKGRPTQFNEMHLAGPAYIEDELCGLTFQVSPQAFFQPNREVASKMFDEAAALLEFTGEEKILDLYCGIGTIGMILSKYVRQVIGLELNPIAVCDAKDNIERLGIENMQVYQGDVGTTLGGILEFFTPDVIVVDPPRCGLDDKTKKMIATVRPKKLLYISCNPKSQTADISELQDYSIAKIVPFDQFPHTKHVENIVLLLSNDP